MIDTTKCMPSFAVKYFEKDEMQRSYELPRNRKPECMWQCNKARSLYNLRNTTPLKYLPMLQMA